jgi:hypothetical protein
MSRSAVAIVVLASTALVAPVGMTAQATKAGERTGAAKQRAWSPPRTPWGDPDLEGLWPGTQMMGVPLERPVQQAGRTLLTDEELAQREAQARRQADADNEEFVASRPAGTGTGPPAHCGDDELQR